MTTLKNYTAVFAALACATILAACGAFGQKYNPVQVAAQTGKPELVVFALEGSYTIVQGRALQVASLSSTPVSVVRAIKSIDAKAGPILDAAKPLALEVEQLRIKLANGEDVQQRLIVVLNDLDRLITEVSPLITELTQAISDATGGV